MPSPRTAPLLERERELALLEEAWREARRGRGSAWLVCAEAGGGKTRLMREFARPAGGAVRWGAAEPLAPPEPYQAVRAALPRLEPAATRAETVDRAIETLAGAAGNGPALCVLDDLHFGDDGTVAVLARLARECRGRPWLVLAAFRPEEGPEALRLAAIELEAQGVAGRLDLPLLSRAAVGELVAHVAGAEAGADAIYADSGGNPWLAEALARGGASVGTVRNRIVLKLDRLEAASPGAFALLCALAPATRPLPHALVGDLAGGDTRALRRTLAELRDAGLIVEGHDGWQFRHEILRRSLLEALIGAERRDAHRVLAENLERREGGAAELAMHYAAADDRRAVDWALRAAREARAVDAHAEALAQLERALAFDLDDELRRSTLEAAATELHDLGRSVDERRRAEEALAIPGGEPEVRARLHQFAARAASASSDSAGDEAHLAAAEAALAGRPVSRQMVNIACARVARAAVYYAPHDLPQRAANARRLAAELGDPLVVATAGAQATGYEALSAISSGDPRGFELLEEALRIAAEGGAMAGVSAVALLNAYEEAVILQFHDRTPGLRERVLELMRRVQIDWQRDVDIYHALELVQRGRYEDARRSLTALQSPDRGTNCYGVHLWATAMLETRAGSAERARALLDAAQPDAALNEIWPVELARLELATLTSDPSAAEMAAALYASAEPRRFARGAGMAAVALARACREAPATPAWLAAGSPLRLHWRWAEGIAREDSEALRDVSDSLAALDCSYEAALALRDAGDLTAAYRTLRDLEATTAREQTATALRAAGLPVPRRTRAATTPGGLTDTELEVARLVAGGATNNEVAAALGMSAFTVATHLTHIYAKAGVRGRAAFASWWARAVAAE